MEPENFKKRIIFVSVFNDIEWKKKDVNCISNAEKSQKITQRGFHKDIGGLFWVQVRKRNGTAAHVMDNSDRTANKMAQQFKEIGHPIFTATSALSRGMSQQRKGKCTIHFNGDFMNIGVLFQTNHTVNQVSIYAVVTNWCYKFALKKENKNTFLHPWIIELRLLWKPKCLLRTKHWETWWCRMRQKFRVLEKKFSHDPIFVKKLYSNIMSQQEVDTKFDQMEKVDGVKSHLCREYTCSRAFPQAKPLGTIPAGTIIGPISEVLVVKLLDECGVEVAMPSILQNLETCLTLRYPGKPSAMWMKFTLTNKKPRSSGELLENLRESKESMSYKQREATTGSEETWVAPSIGETRAGFVNFVPNKSSVYTRKTIPRNEENWIAVLSNPTRGSDLTIFIFETVTTMLRHFDQGERESDGSRHWEAIKSALLRKFERDGVQDFNDEVWLQKIFEGSSKKRIEVCKKKMDFLVIHERFKGILEVFQANHNWWVM